MGENRTRQTPVLIFLKKPSRPLLSSILIFGLCILGYVSIPIWPSIAAQGADVLRGWIGDQVVTWLETKLFQTQDAIRRLEYQWGMEPQSPWTASTPNSDGRIEYTPAASSFAPPQNSDTGAGNYSGTAIAVSTPNPTATPKRWFPKPIPSIGSLPGEGQWSAYFTNANGEVVAYRTFLQPDPMRPYALLAIVAFDLAKVQLHYVLGYEEPVTKVLIARPGRIPEVDRKRDILLAAFNGGFLTRHGSYGVMVNRKILVPLKDGMGTLTIAADHRLAIEAWNGDVISMRDDIETIRQNGPMILENGHITSKADSNSIADWGATIQGEVSTWRSAIGLSRDRNTLYYAAGWNLTMPPLARALWTAGVYDAIQLDINDYWVLFSRIDFSHDKPAAIPLVAQMADHGNRFLSANARDFFYLTEVH
jgi:hypothetical protein